MKRTAILFTFFMIGIIILADMGRLPYFVTALVGELPNGDRIGHFVLFGILNFFITRAMISAFSTRDPLRVAIFTGLILILFVAAEEYSQNYFSQRTADWVDLIAGCAGMYIGGVIAFKRRVMG